MIINYFRVSAAKAMSSLRMISVKKFFSGEFSARSKLYGSSIVNLSQANQCCDISTLSAVFRFYGVSPKLIATIKAIVNFTFLPVIGNYSTPARSPPFSSPLNIIFLSDFHPTKLPNRRCSFCACAGCSHGDRCLGLPAVSLPNRSISSL